MAITYLTTHANGFSTMCVNSFKPLMTIDLILLHTDLKGVQGGFVADFFQSERLHRSLLATMD